MTLSRHAVLALAVAVFLAAFFVRVHDLEGVPPGLQHDEVFRAHDVLLMRRMDHIPLYFTSNNGTEPLYTYLMHFTMLALGSSYFGIRMASVLCGMGTLVTLWLWGRALLGRREAWLALALAAFGFWPLFISRVGLRVASAPVLVALVGWLYWRALGRESWANAHYALAGAVLGLSLYTYLAVRAAPAAWAAFQGYLLFTREGRAFMRRRWHQHIVFWLACALVVAPLAYAIATLEGADVRVQQVSAPLDAFLAGDPGPLLENTLKTLGMWFVRGDPTWRYNLAGRPVFPWVTGLVFLVGLLAAAWTARPRANLTPRGMACAFVLIVLLVGVLPSAVTTDAPAFFRAVVALPSTYLIAALGLVWMWNHALKPRISAQRRHIVAAGGLALVFSGVILFTVVDYFIRWPAHPEVQSAYRSSLTSVAHHLDAHDAPEAVVISTGDPHHLDPFVFGYTLRTPRPLRWVDGMFALSFPAGDAAGWLYITDEPTPPPRLQAGFLDHLDLLEERRLTGETLGYRLYVLPPAGLALERFPPPRKQGAWISDMVIFPPDLPAPGWRRLEFPVHFEDTLTLLGYEAMPEVTPGSLLEMTLYWRAEVAPGAPRAWAVFAHLLDAESQVIAARDFLGFPPASWHTGDVFVQLHDLWVGDVLSGTYALEIGVYSLEDMTRFPVLDAAGAPLGDRLLLAPVTVR